MGKATQLEYALLGLIRHGVGTGYELRKQFASTPIGHYSDSPGSIYPALKRLAERGWIERIAERSGPRRRVAFGLTKAGAAALRNWLNAPLRPGDVVRRGDELLLRFAFMGGSVSRMATVSFLRTFERQAAEYSAELRSLLKTLPREELPTGSLALENGLMHFETQVRWARRAIKRLRRLQ
jgi:DNA-binding PadR family transcriptional regulator